MNLHKLNIDKTWTLFLDRDGVINKKIENNYVRKWDEFEFLPGVLEAIKIFSNTFGRIIVVTNQQGIAKERMTEDELTQIHEQMVKEIEKNGGRIDAIFYAPYLKEINHIDRKPNVGMALKAKKKFPEINFKKAIIAGDSQSDMEMGARMNMIKILINNDISIAQKQPKLVNFTYKSLYDFSFVLNKL